MNILVGNFPAEVTPFAALFHVLFGTALVASAVRESAATNQHLAKAAADAAEGSLLAKNLLTHCHLFEVRAGTLAELRSQLVVAKN